MAPLELVPMDAASGSIIARRQQGCLLHFGHGSFKMRAGSGYPHQQQQVWTVKNSTVNVISALPRNSVIVCARRRNALRSKLLKSLQRRTIYNDNQITVDSEVRIGLEETAAEKTDDNPKGDNGNSEATVFEVEGFDDSDSITERNLTQKSSIQGEKVDMEGSNSSLKSHGANLWDSWNSWNAQYRKDIRVWGIGGGPIFVIWESDEGEVLKVSIDEAEIRKRCGAEPFLALHPDETAVSTSYAKITQARKLALDIEAGVFKPPSNSTVFGFVHPAKNDLEKWGVLGSVFCQARSVMGPISPILQISLIGFVVMSGFHFMSAAQKHLASNAQSVWGRMGREKGKILMRNLNSAAWKGGEDDRVSRVSLSNTEALSDEAELRKKGLALKSSSKGGLPMDEAAFEKKVLEIRAMARQARMTEQRSSQLSSKQRQKDHPRYSNPVGISSGESKQGEDYSSKFSTAGRNAEDKAKVDNHRNQSDVELNMKPENVIQNKSNVLSEEAEEFHWLRDEVLRRIVLKVQANEKAGREPFYGLVSEEELLFFKGLERKFEREGERVKKWIRERVQNLKYAKDAVGIDHPPEAFTGDCKDSNKTGIFSMPEKDDKDCQKFTTEGTGLDHPTVPESENMVVVTQQISTCISSSAISTNSSTSVAEVSLCRDRGVAEEKVEQVSQVLPEGLQGQIENSERINSKMKKKSEWYGAGTILNKDTECKQEMQDHLWWWRLPYVLCIALYRNNEDEVLKGFYSLEMTPGIQSASNNYHTIAFQDRGDATNFCYILQSHFKELKSASIHVILRSAKEFYEEAKSRAFRVIVIKKGQLQLYVGQPLKEVESRIIKIGTAMYHEKPVEAV